MNWGSILVFIVIALVSSIFNKNKEQQRRARNSQDSNPGPPPAVGQSHQPVVKTSQQPKPRSGPMGLEDMLKEFQRDISTVFGSPQPTAETPVETIKPTEVELERYQEDDSTLKETTYTTEDDVAREPEAVGSIYEKEIGRRPEPSFSFNKNSLMNSVVMAEILGKPKSLQKR